MNTPGGNRTAFGCPRCYRLVFLTEPPHQTLPDGMVLANVATLVAGMRLHIGRCPG